jgi:hypothetical protein
MLGICWVRLSHVSNDFLHPKLRHLAYPSRHQHPTGYLNYGTAIGCEVAFRRSCSENPSDALVLTIFDATISLESEVVSIYASI